MSASLRGNVPAEWKWLMGHMTVLNHLALLSTKPVTSLHASCNCLSHSCWSWASINDTGRALVVNDHGCIADEIRSSGDNGVGCWSVVKDSMAEASLGSV